MITLKCPPIILLTLHNLSQQYLYKANQKNLVLIYWILFFKEVSGSLQFQYNSAGHGNITKLHVK